MYGQWNEYYRKDYANVRRKWLKTYSKTDDILYAMCNRWSGHGDFGANQAKVRIIGRVYGTGLERKGNKDKSKGVYETVAELFCKNKAWLDRELQILRRFKQPEAASERILALHGRLVRLLKEQTKSKVNFRSFVSKYLHFHASIVPIFDNQSSVTINSRDWYPLRKSGHRPTIPMKKEYDPIYFKFFLQFLLYYSDLQELTLKPTVRNADYYLIKSYWDEA